MSTSNFSAISVSIVIFESVSPSSILLIWWGSTPHLKANSEIVQPLIFRNFLTLFPTIKIAS